MSLSRRYGDLTDEDEKYLAKDNREQKASWKNNVSIPLGAFGAFLALGAGVVYMKRNSSLGLSNSIMQARVIAQGTCLAGLIGAGVYAAYSGKEDKEYDPNRG